MAQVSSVEEVLRRRDPIGVSPGLAGPADEYDSCAPHRYFWVYYDLRWHLRKLRAESIGVALDDEADRQTALAIFRALRAPAV